MTEVERAAKRPAALAKQQQQDVRRFVIPN